MTESIGTRCEYRREHLRWPFHKLDYWQHRWLWRMPFLKWVERCDRDGMECGYPYDPDHPGDEITHYCREHATDVGFCWGCGQFWGGVESFDFSPNGLCDNCRDNPDYSDDYYDDEDYPCEPYEETYINATQD